MLNPPINQDLHRHIYPSDVQEKAWDPGLLDCENTSTFSATMKEE